RRRMLEEIAEKETRLDVARAYAALKGLDAEDAIGRLLARRGRTRNGLTVLFFAWTPRAEASEDALLRFLAAHGERNVTAGEGAKLYKAYGNPRLTLAD